VGIGRDGQAADAVAGTPAGVKAGAQAAVLGCDQARADE
jgi:hypothetical protein